MASALLTPGIDEVREHRGWFLIWGIVLIVLGAIAVGSSEIASLVPVIFFGWLSAVLRGALLDHPRTDTPPLARLLPQPAGGLALHRGGVADGLESGDGGADVDAADRDAPHGRWNLPALRRVLACAASSRLADPGVGEIRSCGNQ